MAASPLALTVAMRSMSALPDTFRDCCFTFATTASIALSMPRFRSIGLKPASISLMPSVYSAWVSTVAVVVPSPVSSLVREATSRTSSQPMF